jgi:tetratricopeptide (TPR) repeat protein
MIRITLIIIAWSLLLLVYLGNANVRASVIAQNSDEPPMDEEPPATNETTTTTEEPLTTNVSALDALEYYDRPLAIDPDNTNALTNKGAAVAGLGRYEEAIGYFDRVLNIDPNYIPALVNKGALLSAI